MSHISASECDPAAVVSGAMAVDEFCPALNCHGFPASRRWLPITFFSYRVADTGISLHKHSIGGGYSIKFRCPFCCVVHSHTFFRAAKD
ncbi:MAG: hypothetical protein R3D69_06460 [Xanthobacteraceae bacterium]